MKSCSIVSAPVRYLAYAAVLAMTLSSLLQIPEIQRSQHLPVISELCLQSHAKAADIAKPFPGKNPFAKEPPWKITTEAILRFLQNKAETILPFYFHENVSDGFFGKQWITQPTHTSGK